MDEALKKLIEERLKCSADMRAILDDAEKNSGSVVSAEKDEEYKKLEARLDGLGTQIERRTKLIEAEKRIALPLTQAAATNAGAGDPQKDEQRAELQTRMLRAFIKEGPQAIHREEFRALAAGALTEGGAMIPPEQFVAELIKAVDDAVIIRQLARKFTITSSSSLGAPVLDADPADADWTTEIATGSEDSTMSFGKRELAPNPIAKLIKVSRTLIQRSAIPVEALVRERLAYKFAITEEKAFMTGNGASKPLGVFTASAQGIPTSRDVSSGNTTTSMTWDGLINALGSLKEQHQMAATWIFHRDGITQIRKLKDGQGQYLWQPSLVAGNPDTVLNRPVRQSEYAPNTFTTGLYTGVVGNFQHYWIADVLGMELQRLLELYAATNQVGFIGRLETDGMPVLAEAFARVKLA